MSICTALLLTLAAAPAGKVIEIQVVNSTPQAARAAKLLASLIDTHDLTRWTFTNKAIVDGDPKVIPHSHPVLTVRPRR